MHSSPNFFFINFFFFKRLIVTFMSQLLQQIKMINISSTFLKIVNRMILPISNYT